MRGDDLDRVLRELRRMEEARGNDNENDLKDEFNQTYYNLGNFKIEQDKEGNIINDFFSGIGVDVKLNLPQFDPEFDFKDDDKALKRHPNYKKNDDYGYSRYSLHACVGLKNTFTKALVDGQAAKFIEDILY